MQPEDYLKPQPLVYLLWVQRFDLFKVGFSGNFPRRVSDIQNHLPFQVRVIALKPATRETETRLKRSLRRWRVRGEWFDLPEDQVWGLLRWFGEEIPADVEASIVAA